MMDFLSEIVTGSVTFALTTALVVFIVKRIYKNIDQVNDQYVCLLQKISEIHEAVMLIQKDHGYSSDMIQDLKKDILFCKRENSDLKERIHKLSTEMASIRGGIEKYYVNLDKKLQ